MHGEGERGFVVCARDTFDASKEWKRENEKKERSIGGIQNCGYIPSVASPSLSASSLKLFSKRFIQSRVWRQMFDGKSLNIKNNTIEEYK